MLYRSAIAPLAFVVALAAAACVERIQPGDGPGADAGDPAGGPDAGAGNDAGTDLTGLASIAIAAPPGDLPAGRVAPFAATGRLDDGTDVDVTVAATWSSSNEAAATVANGPGAAGRVTAVAPGTTTIEARIGDVAATLVVKVTAAVRDAITVEPVATSVPLGAATSLHARGVMSDGATEDLTAIVAWRSRDLDVALVSTADGTKGEVTPVAEGVAVIEASFEGQIGTGTVTVQPPAVVSIAVAPPTRTAALGVTTSFTATAQLTDGSNRDVTDEAEWTSLDPGIAVVEETPGDVRGTAQGEVVVRAQLPGGGAQATATLTVGPPVLVGLTTFDRTSFALNSAGEVWCWGRNTNGQCARAPTAQITSAVKLNGLTDVVALASGSGHVLALARDGTVWAWGKYHRGQLGDGRTLPVPAIEDPYAQTTPVQVVGEGGTGFLTDIVAISAGLDHSLAVRADGAAFAWGDGGMGRLGTGNTSSTSTPKRMLGIAKAIGISGGAYHSLVVDADGYAWATGWGEDGQTGQGAVAPALSTPALVLAADGGGPLEDVVEVSAGWTHSLARLSDGTAWCWGDNGVGQCGTGSDTIENHVLPVQVKAIGGTAAALNNVTKIEAGFLFSTAKVGAGTIVTWGYNYYGQLGVAGIADAQGGAYQRNFPERVQTAAGTNITNVVEWGAGADHIVVLRTGGTTLAWGSDFEGERGDGNAGEPSTYIPAAVSGL